MSRLTDAFGNPVPVAPPLPSASADAAIDHLSDATEAHEAGSASAQTHLSAALVLAVLAVAERLGELAEAVRDGQQ